MWYVVRSGGIVLPSSNWSRFLCISHSLIWSVTCGGIMGFCIDTHISHTTHITSHTSHTYHTHHTPHTSHTTYNEMLITCSTFHYIQTYHTTHHTIHTSHHTHITYNAILITCSKFHCNDNYHAHNTLPVIRISFAYIRIIISKNIIHPSLSSYNNNIICLSSLS